jgi:hypothetical protein
MADILKRGRAALIAAVLVAGCADGPTAPFEPVPQYTAAAGAALIECPSAVGRSVSGTLGPLGGTLELDGTRISLPPLAVLRSTEFTLTLPASNYMEVQIRAGTAEHFRFTLPATIVIDYARCTRSDIDKAPLGVWHIDPITKALLDVMGGADDKTSRTVTFQTDHLSGFSIAQ